jgi:hypothetical protein
MRVFLSHSYADRKLAAMLRERLEGKGLTVSLLDKEPGSAGWRDLEEAIRSAAAILLLVSPKVDEPQRTTWRLALEAVWANPSKRLIPILVQDAELPAFVKSASSDGEVRAIRLRGAKDLNLTIHAILRTLGIESGEQLAKKRANGAYRDRDGETATVALINPPSTSSGPIETYPAVTDKDRARQREDFAAIRKYAEQLKH